MTRDTPHPDDSELFTQLTGMEEMPEEFLSEYWLALQLQHKTGRIGRLNTEMMCVLLLNNRKHLPKNNKQDDTQTNWGSVPLNSPVVVTSKAPVEFQGRSGEFVGTVGSGSLGVRFDGDSFVHEFKSYWAKPRKSPEQDGINLGTIQVDAEPEPVDRFAQKEREQERARLEKLEKEAEDSVEESNSEKTTKKRGRGRPKGSKTKKADEKDSGKNNGKENTSSTLIEDDHGVGWAEVPQGSKVWVTSESGDLLDGEFQGISDDGNLGIFMPEEGDHRLVEKDKVKLVG